MKTTYYRDGSGGEVEDDVLELRERIEVLEMELKAFRANERHWQQELKWLLSGDQGPTTAIELRDMLADAL